MRIGWAEVSAAWQAQAAWNLRGQIEPDDLRITVGRDLAATHGYVRGHNFGELPRRARRADARGTRQEVAIRDSNPFRREDGEWRMIARHSDVLPFLRQ